MKVQILGGGCPNCRKLAENAQVAIRELSLDAEIEKITDSDTIMEMGALLTPALAVDGQVKSSGKVLSSEEIAALLH